MSWEVLCRDIIDVIHKGQVTNSPAAVQLCQGLALLLRSDGKDMKLSVQMISKAQEVAANNNQEVDITSYSLLATWISDQVETLLSGHSEPGQKDPSYPALIEVASKLLT